MSSASSSSSSSSDAAAAVTQVLTSNEMKELYHMLHDFHQICAAHNLMYWVDAGTFLGLVRHQGIIPWDHDVDVSIPLDDWKKMTSKSMASALSSRNLKWDRDDTRPKLVRAGKNESKSKSQKQGKGKKPKFYLDIYVRYLQTDSDTVDPFVSRDMRKHKPKCVHHRVDELFPLEQITFGKYLKIMAPRTSALLDNCYEDWTDYMDIPMENIDKSGRHIVRVPIPKDEPTLPFGQKTFQPPSNDLPLAGKRIPRII